MQPAICMADTKIIIEFLIVNDLQTVRVITVPSHVHVYYSIKILCTSIIINLFPLQHTTQVLSIILHYQTSRK